MPATEVIDLFTRRKVSLAHPSTMSPAMSSAAAPIRTCIDCKHASLGQITYCGQFREEIWDEDEAAAGCDEFGL